MLAAPAARRADYVENLNIFQIGDTRTGPVTLDWNHFYDGSQAPEDTVTLEIVAEGIDSNGPNGLEEDDQVFFNGTLLGLLTHQLFYSADFNIKAGQGALGFPDTELSTSVFNVNPGLLQVGNNLVQIVVDPANWIMEAETSSLRVTAA